MWEMTFTAHTYNKGSISRICEKLLQLNEKKDRQYKNEQKPWTNSSQNHQSPGTGSFTSS